MPVTGCAIHDTNDNKRVGLAESIGGRKALASVCAEERVVKFVCRKWSNPVQGGWELLRHPQSAMFLAIWLAGAHFVKEQ